MQRDPVTGEVVLSAKPIDWRGFVQLARPLSAPQDFLADRDDAPAAEREARLFTATNP